LDLTKNLQILRFLIIVFFVEAYGISESIVMVLLGRTRKCRLCSGTYFFVLIFLKEICLVKEPFAEGYQDFSIFIFGKVLNVLKLCPIYQSIKSLSAVGKF
jgi:hypothetical protein